MKTKTNRKLIQLLLLIIGTTLQISCKKEFDKQVQTTTKNNFERIAGRVDKVNPYEIGNIKNSLIALGRNEQLDENRIYYYYKFNPLKITGDILSKLELDSMLKIMDIPFADGSFYSE
jgi:hypothetical protein